MWGGEPAQAEKLPQVDGGLVASREPLPGVLDWLRFHHEAHLSGFLPQGQLGGGGWGGLVSRFQRQQQVPGACPAGKGQAEGGGEAFVSGLDIWDLLPSRLKLVTAEC